MYTETIEDKRMKWFNFRTGQYDYIEIPTDFSDYIPQSQAAQGMYRLLVYDMGVTPIEASLRVLNACAGKK